MTTHLPCIVSGPVPAERVGRRAPGAVAQPRVGRALVALLASLGVAACGGGEIPLGSACSVPGSVSTRASGTDAPDSLAAARAIFADRALGRSGLSCADCHRIVDPAHADDGPPRPGAPLQIDPSGADGAAAALVDRCVERYLLRPAHATPGARPLRAWARRAGAVAGGRAGAIGETPAEETYAAACAHCHEQGPAGPVRGRLWTREALTEAIRAPSRPRHPGTLMPPFPTDRLSEPVADALIRWLVAVGRADSARDSQSAPGDASLGRVRPPSVLGRHLAVEKMTR